MLTVYPPVDALDSFEWSPQMRADPLASPGGSAAPAGSLPGAVGEALLARWRHRMLKVGFAASGASYTGIQLEERFEGGVLRVRLATLEHAKFADWGVGRGRPLRQNGRFTDREGYRQVFYSRYVRNDAGWTKWYVFHVLRKELRESLSLLSPRSMP